MCVKASITFISLALAAISGSSFALELTDLSSAGDCSLTRVELRPQEEDNLKVDILIKSEELNRQFVGSSDSLSCYLNVNLALPEDLRVEGLSSSLAYLYSFDGLALFRLSSSLRLYLQPEVRQSDVWKSEAGSSEIGLRRVRNQADLDESSEIICGAPASLKLGYKASVSGKEAVENYLALFLEPAPQIDQGIWLKMGEIRLGRCQDDENTAGEAEAEQEPLPAELDQITPVSH